MFSWVIAGGRTLIHPLTMKNPTSQEHQGSVEQSLEKFKELRRDLGPDATVDQKRYLDEMIFLGERAVGVATQHHRMAQKPVSPFSLSWWRVGKRLLLIAVLFIFTVALYVVLGWV